MSVVERLGEGLARRTSRRQTVKRAAAALFGLTAAWSVQGPFGSTALAKRCRPRNDDHCDCAPPNGVYCGTSGCDQARCAGGCVPTADFGYLGACWCTKVCAHGPKKGYYKCCDCRCGYEYCGCRKFVAVR